MAKETSYPPFALFLASALLMTGGWFMASFPIFIFMGLGPIFALTDRATSTASVWEKMEWVLLALSLSFLAARFFELSQLVSSIAFGILFTLPFIGYVWVKQTLGPRVGKVSIVLFWLALEYLLLKIYPSSSPFLADALRLQPAWTRWNTHTGYLGASAWILMANLMVYYAILSRNPFRWQWILLAVIFIVSPFISYYFFEPISITRTDMLKLYSENSTTTNVMYLARGEFIVRTAAWISTLILLFTLVKSQTTKA